MSKNKGVIGLASENACDFCNQNYPCGTLKAAIEILSKESETANNTYSRELTREFLDKLSHYGYHFPVSDKMCWLNDKRPIVNDLVREATRLIEEVRTRRMAIT